MCNLVGPEGAPTTCMIGPAKYTRFEESAVDDQLRTALEQVEQAHLAIRPVKLILLFDCHPRHSPALGSQRITLAHNPLFLDQQFVTSFHPFLRRHDLRALSHVRCHVDLSFGLSRWHLFSAQVPDCDCRSSARRGHFAGKQHRSCYAHWTHGSSSLRSGNLVSCL